MDDIDFYGISAFLGLFTLFVVIVGAVLTLVMALSRVISHPTKKMG